MLYRLAFLLGPSVSRMYNLELRSTLEEQVANLILIWVLSLFRLVHLCTMIPANFAITVRTPKMASLKLRFLGHL